MNGLSLEQAPPYKIPLFYYMMGVFYLLLFAAAVSFYALKIDDRHYYEAIAIVHIFTLGFFTHIMFGTLFQMVPVIIGESYDHVDLGSEFIFVTLNIGIAGFLFYFLTGSEIFSFIAMLFLGIALIDFAIYSIKTVVRTKHKNSTVKTFLTAFVFLALGSILGILSVLQHDGLLGDARFGDIHFSIMIFGWVFLLFSGVAYKVLPMFYVAKEYPHFIKNYFYIIISLTLAIMFFFTLFELEEGIKISKIVLASLVLFFALTTIKILKERKRARSDVTVNFFYFANINLAVGSILWLADISFHLKLDILIGILLGVGFIYGLINGMLYKIVPFLTWFHLSSKAVFEAEMSEVIQVKLMRMQFYIFTASYISLIISLLYKPFVLVAAAFFFISSLLLLYNIVSGYIYHSKMIKKALRYE